MQAIKYLTPFESPSSTYRILQILLIHNDNDNDKQSYDLYQRYLKAKNSFLNKHNYIDGFVLKLNNKANTNMIDLCYEYMTNYLPLKDAIMLKQVCSYNPQECKVDTAVKPVMIYRSN